MVTEKLIELSQVELRLIGQVGGGREEEGNK